MGFISSKSVVLSELPATPDLLPCNVCGYIPTMKRKVEHGEENWVLKCACSEYTAWGVTQEDAADEWDDINSEEEFDEDE